MKTLYKTVALILIAPILVGAVMFGSGLLVLFALIGGLYDAPNTAELPRPGEQ